jgi:hypothetical protein
MAQERSVDSGDDLIFPQVLTFHHTSEVFPQRLKPNLSFAPSRHEETALIFLGWNCFQPTKGELATSLTVFSHQLQQWDLSMSQVPEGFVQRRLPLAAQVFAKAHA